MVPTPMSISENSKIIITIIRYLLVLHGISIFGNVHFRDNFSKAYFFKSTKDISIKFSVAYFKYC